MLVKKHGAEQHQQDTKQIDTLTNQLVQTSTDLDEQNIARRLEWMRQGVFASTDQKGAQQLMQGLKPAQTRAVGRPNYDLNVEVRSDGSVRVVPPATNGAAPAPR